MRTLLHADGFSHLAWMRRSEAELDLSKRSGGVINRSVKKMLVTIASMSVVDELQSQVKLASAEK